MSDIVARFRSAMADGGILYEGELIADGLRHRFKPEGDRRENGVYQLWNDDHPAGWAKEDYKRDVYVTWSSQNGLKVTAAERRAWQERLALFKREREAAEKEYHANARARAQAQWDAAKPETGEHRYLRDKGVGAHGLRSNGLLLYVPVRDTGGVLHGLQTLSPDGAKNFPAGTAKRGHYHVICEPKGRILIAEGYATAATLHECTGEAVAVAFDAGNLKPVAEALRKKTPAIEIIICADNDRWTKGNPGLSKAREAARAVGAKLAVPRFRDPAAQKGEKPPTDFNDLHRLEGVEAVREHAGLVIEPTLREIPADLIVNAPGMIGEFIDWYLGCARNPEPVYALASALAFFSAAIGPRRNVKKTWLNNYVITLGPTESGKRHILAASANALYAIQDVLMNNEAVAVKAFNHRFESEQAVWWTISKDGPAAIFYEEIGRLLERSTDSKSLEFGIVSAFMLLYDAVNSELVLPPRYSEQSKTANEMPPLSHPFLSVHGSTTPGFYKKAKALVAEDGSLNRFLILNCEGLTKARYTEFDDPLPKTLIEFFRNFSHVQTELEYAPGAEQLLYARTEAIRAQLRKSPGTYGRYGYKSAKLGLMAAVLSKGKEISPENTTWACDLVENASSIATQKFSEGGGLARSRTDALERAIKAMFEKKTVQRNHNCLTRKMLAQYCYAWREADAGFRASTLKGMVADGVLITIKGGFKLASEDEEHSGV